MSGAWPPVAWLLLLLVLPYSSSFPARSLLRVNPMGIGVIDSLLFISSPSRILSNIVARGFIRFPSAYNLDTVLSLLFADFLRALCGRSLRTPRFKVLMRPG